MIKHNPPYLIHCEMGIDRTGFFAILLESFMQAEFDDMAKDYMLSFVDDNNYSEEDCRNGSIFALDFFSNINGGPVKIGDDLQGITVKYLTEKAGLSNKELLLLKDKLRNLKKDNGFDAFGNMAHCQSVSFKCDKAEFQRFKRFGYILKGVAITLNRREANLGGS